MRHIIKNLVHTVKLVLIGTMALISFSCQDEFIPEEVPNAEQYVIEGYVEAGEGSQFSYVIISRSVPFFSEISTQQYASLFVSNANVEVNDGDKTVSFTKLCLSDIPDELKEQAGQVLGINPDSTDVDLCIYVDILDELTRESGRTYSLKINFDDNDEELTAETTIPEGIDLFDFNFRDTPGEPIEGKAQLFTRINDPSEANFYRYFTDADSTGLIPPFSSVTDDTAFNGQEFEFPISKAESPNGEFDPNTFGMFTLGDTITLKWCTIDKAHFDFWNTFEFARNNQGPFSSYTRIKSNIIGEGWGIFGGYAVHSSELVVEK